MSEFVDLVIRVSKDDLAGLLARSDRVVLQSVADHHPKDESPPTPENNPNDSIPTDPPETNPLPIPEVEVVPSPSPLDPSPTPPPPQEPTPPVQKPKKPALGHGFNMREAIHHEEYDQGWEPVQKTFEEAQRIGMTMARIYPMHRDVTMPTTIARCVRLLNLAESTGMSVIMPMTDWQPSPHKTRGDHDIGTMAWYTGTKDASYRHHYLPAMKTLLKEIGDHPALKIVSPGNEFQLPPNTAPTEQTARIFLDFFKEATDTIRDVAPRVHVISGCQGAWHLFAWDVDKRYEEFYSNFDLLDCHSHFDIQKGFSQGKMGANTNNVDRTLHYGKLLNKKVILGELGCLRKKGQHATGFIQTAIQEFMASGGDACLQWSYGYAFVDGYGMNDTWPDWTPLRQVWIDAVKAL